MRSEHKSENLSDQIPNANSVTIQLSSCVKAPWLSSLLTIIQISDNLYWKWTTSPVPLLQSGLDILHRIHTLPDHVIRPNLANMIGLWIVLVAVISRYRLAQQLVQPCLGQPSLRK